MRETVRVFAPATVANVGSAFDILGFALEAPGDTCIARLTPEREVTVSAVTSPYGAIPLDPKKNTAAVAAAAVLELAGSSKGIDLDIRKNMPLGSGLGSSAASAAAGAYAADILLDAKLPFSALVECAMEGERVACGTAHADNVAPSIMGGVVLIRSYEPLDLIQMQAPPDLFCSVVYPTIEVRTEDARRVLRREVALRDAVTQMGNVGGLIAGFLTHDIPLIARSLQDVLIEPERSDLIPGFEKTKQAALGSGALGVGISGSGPSLFAFSGSMEAASRVAEAIAASFQDLGIGTMTFTGQAGARGARIEE